MRSSCSPWSCSAPCTSAASVRVSCAVCVSEPGCHQLDEVGRRCFDRLRPGHVGLRRHYRCVPARGSVLQATFSMCIAGSSLCMLSMRVCMCASTVTLQRQHTAAHPCGTLGGLRRLLVPAQGQLHLALLIIPLRLLLLAALLQRHHEVNEAHGLSLLAPAAHSDRCSWVNKLCLAEAATTG